MDPDWIRKFFSQGSKFSSGPGCIGDPQDGLPLPVIGVSLKGAIITPDFLLSSSEGRGTAGG